jgi:integrase
MRAKIVLLARVKGQDGRYPFISVTLKKGRPVPVEGATAYYLRFSEHHKRKLVSVGVNLDKAFVAYQNRELNLTRTRMGLSPIGLLEDVKQNASNRLRIADAVTKYIADLEASVTTGERSKGTWRGYKNAVDDFRDQCGVEFMDEITGEILKAHKLYLFENIKKRVRGKKSNTVAKRFRFLSAFLTKNGIQMTKAKNPKAGDNGLMDWSDVPREQKKEYINKYSEEEINAMLAVADQDEADFVQTFVRTGCRDEEIVFLHWTDVDFKRKQIVISEKPKYGWKTKDREARTIPLEDGLLLKRLAARKQRQSPASNLVFPNTNGDPDQHLIRRLHKIVAKAEANGFEFEGDITLHRFRRTYASMMISHSDLQTVSSLLGHSDVQTTALYLAPDQSKARAGTRTAFRGISD